MLGLSEQKAEWGVKWSGIDTKVQLLYLNGQKNNIDNIKFFNYPHSSPTVVLFAM